MNWIILFAAWLLGRWSSGRDLTTWDAPPTSSPPSPPRPTASTTSRPATTTRTPPARPTVPASTSASAPPWPQAVPAGLPDWPGGWEPDEPVGAGVASRAAALLPQLWAHGENTRKTEQTGGRWITYVARAMGSKRGVVAFRPKRSASPAPAPSSASAYVPVSTPTAGPMAPFNPGSRTLRRGDQGTDVWYLQGRLGIGTDGIFGGGTEAAVRTYQGTHRPPLSPDGVVGPRTWAALLAVSA